MNIYYVLTDHNYNILLKDGTFTPWSGPVLNLPDNVRKFKSPPGQAADALLPAGSRVLTVEEPEHSQSPAA